MFGYLLLSLHLPSMGRIIALLKKNTEHNYSTILSFWDVIFKSRNRKQRTANSVIGVENKNDVGIFGLFMKKSKLSIFIFFKKKRVYNKQIVI